MSRAPWAVLVLALALLACGQPPRPEPPPSPPRPRPPVGRGPGLGRPQVVRPGPDGTVLVVDFASGSLLAVDPRDGSRRRLVDRVDGPAGTPRVEDVAVAPGGTLLALTRTGLHRVREGRLERLPGASFRAASRVARLADGRLAVLDGPAVFLADPGGGRTRLLSGPGRGSGPGLSDTADLAVRQGRLLALEDRVNRVLDLDLATGNRKPWLDLREGAGAPTMSAQSLCVTGGGRLVAPDSVTRRVVEVDPETGARRVLLAPEQPGGVRVDDVFGAAPLPDGSLAVSSPRNGCLLRVGQGGSRTVLSGAPLPAGTLEAVPMGVARDAAGTLWLCDLLGGRLLALAPSSDRPGATGMALPVGLALDGSRAWVADRARGLLEVDLASGRTRVAAPGGDPGAVALGPGGAVYVTDLRRPALLALEGARLREVSGPGRGRGPALLRPMGLAVTEGVALVGDADHHALVEVDLVTGDRRTRFAGEVSGVPRQPAGMVRLDDGSWAVGQEGPLPRRDGTEASGGLMILSLEGSLRFLPGPVRSPSKLARAGPGRVLVSDPEVLRLLEVDLATGAWTVVRSW